MLSYIYRFGQLEKIKVEFLKITVIFLKISENWVRSEILSKILRHQLVVNNKRDQKKEYEKLHNICLHLKCSGELFVWQKSHSLIIIPVIFHYNC